jgi:hypothetical protein
MAQLVAGRIGYWSALIILVALVGCSGEPTPVQQGAEPEASTLPPVAPRPSNSCQLLPTSFSSYEEALARVRGASFRIQEEQSTEKSSWVRGAEYYSCDGLTGYFILTTDRGSFIHQGVPSAVWEDFKQASSYGAYYNRNIKGRYRM